MDEWTLNDLLECSVCFERLDTSSRVLPCQHTFCKKCLVEIVHRHKKLRCPECRVLVEVDIDSLPPNVLLMRILEGMRNAPRKGSTNTCHVPLTTDRIQENDSHNSAEKLLEDRFKFLLHNRGEKNVHERAHLTDRHDENDYQNCTTKLIDEVRDRGRILHNQHSKFFNVPHALALYRFNAKEPGDLSFRKGDIIVLRRKIDNNWYQGECNGVSGVFPLQYVKVIIPMAAEQVAQNISVPSLAPQTPQCKALYDFNKYHEDDEVCLHFNKGDVIIFIRRIDENWAEGMLKDRIGIFPISFVEMNSSAKTLMTVAVQDYSRSREAPPTPTDESVPLISADQSRGGAGVVANAQTYSLSQIPAQVDSFTSPSTSSSSSSSAQSTATTTSPTSSESTTPSPTLSPVSNHAAIKRHSYTMGAVPPPYHAPPAVHRHSAEIINSDDNNVSAAANVPNNQAVVETTSSVEQPQSSSAMITPTCKSSGQSSHISFSSGAAASSTHLHHHHHHNHSPNTFLAAVEHTERNIISQQMKSQVAINDENLIPPIKSSQIGGNKNLGRQGSLRVNKQHQQQLKSLCYSTFVNPPPSLPTKYVALFPYKPQKADEMELRKDRIYTVTEKCQDGWFKGLDGKKSGVFPGNYVTPVVRSPWSSSEFEKCALRGNVQDAQTSTSNVKTSNTSKTANVASMVNSGIINGTRSTPPDLPPRAPSPILPSAVVSQGYSNIWCTADIATAHQSSVKHLTCSANNKKVTTSRVNKENKEVSSGVAVNATFNDANNCDTPVGSKSSAKDRKDKASGSLMKRLASMKISRSPPPSSYSVDNPAFGDGFGPIPARSHARSDSCPSQLSSYNASPLDNSTAVTANNSSTNNGNTTIILAANNAGNVAVRHHTTNTYGCSPNSSPAVAAISSQQQWITRQKYLSHEQPDSRRGILSMTAGKDDHMIILHQKSHSLDTTATGTTAKTISSDDMRLLKSKSSGTASRERYRCIVPYPPNSEFELELRVDDIIHVHKKRDDGWYKGTIQRNGRTGLFPATFVELVK